MTSAKLEQPVRNSGNSTFTSGKQGEGAVCRRHAETRSVMTRENSVALSSANTDIQVNYL